MSDVQKSDIHENPGEILTGVEAGDALRNNVDALTALVHNHAAFNFSPPNIQPTMGRDEVAHVLDVYHYPTEILNQPTVVSRVLGMVKSFNARLGGVSASPAYDLNRLDEAVKYDREGFEWQSREQVNGMAQEGNMVAARVDGKIVGMLGMRKVGRVDGRLLSEDSKASILPEYEGRPLYEHLKASVLPEYEKRGIFRQMKKKAVELNRSESESENPLWLVHSKNPIVLKKTEKYDRKRISFEDYRGLRGWKISDADAAKLKEKWEMEGWQYWIVDFLKAA